MMNPRRLRIVSSRLSKARERMREEQSRFYTILAQIFRPGVQVSWQHGEHRHYGVVEECVRFSDVVFVRNTKTGVSRRLYQHDLQIEG